MDAQAGRERRSVAELERKVSTLEWLILLALVKRARVRPFYRHEDVSGFVCVNYDY
jgi:hypothetical protein